MIHYKENLPIKLPYLPKNLALVIELGILNIIFIDQLMEDMSITGITYSPIQTVYRECIEKVLFGGTFYIAIFYDCWTHP